MTTRKTVALTIRTFVSKVMSFLFNMLSRFVWASLIAQLVKNPPAMQETSVPFLDWENPLEEGMATHCSILAWRIPMDRGAWWATVHGVTKSWTQLSNKAQHSTAQHSTRFVIAFLLKSKNLLLSRLQSSCIVILCSHKPEGNANNSWSTA